MLSASVAMPFVAVNRTKPLVEKLPVFARISVDDLVDQHCQRYSHYSQQQKKSKHRTPPLNLPDSYMTRKETPCFSEGMNCAFPFYLNERPGYTTRGVVPGASPLL
jgi:hypothetical protein